jgi:hypothetical protein
VSVHKITLSYDYDFFLTGVVSSSKDFTLAWHIGKALDLNLIKEKDLEILFLKDCKIFISSYIFESESGKLRLLKNKAASFLNSRHPFLIPELKKYDFFLLLHGDLMTNAKEYLQKLKEVPAIQFIQTIDIHPLPSKENLLI